MQENKKSFQLDYLGGIIFYEKSYAIAYLEVNWLLFLFYNLDLYKYAIVFF